MPLVPSLKASIVCFMAAAALLNIDPKPAEATVQIAASAFTAVPTGSSENASSVPLAGMASIRWRPLQSRWAAALVGGQQQQEVAGVGSAAATGLTTRMVGGQAEFNFDLGDQADQTTAYLGLSAGFAQASADRSLFLDTNGTRLSSAPGYFIAPEAGMRVQCTRRLGMGIAVRYSSVQLMSSLSAGRSATSELNSFGLVWQVYLAL